MKTLIFAETVREARNADRNIGGKVGYRSFKEFDADNLEDADEVIVKGDYPEILEAYKPKPSKKPVFKK